MLTEHDVDKGAIAIDRAVQVLPLAMDPNIRLVDVPATADLALATSAQLLRQGGRELRLPIANRLVGEHEATGQEHLSQISQAEFVTESPKHHERNHIARILHPVQQATTPFVELLRAVQTTETAIALRGAFRALLDGKRSAFRAAHVALPLKPKDRSCTLLGLAITSPDR